MLLRPTINIDEKVTKQENEPFHSILYTDNLKKKQHKKLVGYLRQY